jgi:hypothetical protein
MPGHPPQLGFKVPDGMPSPFQYLGCVRDGALVYCWPNCQSLIVPSSLPEASQRPRESKATV